MGSKIKEEQNRVKALLSDTVTLLCRNGLSFKKNLKVQGLLGITIDDEEVFIVHVNETLGDLVSASDPNQSELQTPTKDGQSGRRSPKRKRRRRSTESNKSHDQEDCVIDLDPDIEIKTEPGMVLIDEVKYEGTPSKQSCRYPDEGLNFAIGSISSQNLNFAAGQGGGSGGSTATNTTNSYNPLNTSATDTVSTSNAGPFVTGIIQNMADTSNQSSPGGSFQWDSSTGQGLPGMSNWASQVAQQTMSQESDMSQQPGPSQGYSPGQRTGTVGVVKLPARKERICTVCSGKYGNGRRRSRTACIHCGLGLHLDCAHLHIHTD